MAGDIALKDSDGGRFAMSVTRPLLLASFVLSCSAPVPMATKDLPTIPFAPTSATDWPLWPTGAGYLVGGSGYVCGPSAPWGLSPGIGIGAVLLPSRLAGTWRTFPGDLPWPPPADLPAPFPVWMGASDAAAHASDRSSVANPAPIPPTASPSGPIPLQLAPSAMPILIRPTKAGPLALPPPLVTPWPPPPFWLAPWGPVQLHGATSTTNQLLLGFPMADGTPVTQASFIPFLRRRDGITEIVLYDPRTRALHSPPGLDGIGTTVGITGRDGLVLVGIASSGGPLRLLDLLSGGQDPLVELTDASPGVNGNLCWRGAVVPYTAGVPGRREIRLFDRRTRMIDCLTRLNAGADTFAPAPDQLARHLAFVTTRQGQTDLGVYDTVTGLVDPLPAVNSGANERLPALDDSGRWLAYVSEGDGKARARLYDRATRSLDTLPDLTGLGPVVNVTISNDGLFLVLIVRQDGHLRALLYLRPSGVIDPLPEVNDPRSDVFY